MTADLPEAIGRKLPRYPLIPAIRMGRLAVDRAARGQGVGGALLADALLRSASSDIGAYALLVDSKDDAAAAFYEYRGFLRFANHSRVLFLPLATVKGLMGAAARENSMPR